MIARPNIARVAITLGVVGSLAGNTAWAWDRSPVLVGVGIAMSLVLPVAVILWGASKGATGWPRVERAIVMGAICGGAALYTLVHSSSLLAEKGLPWVIAWVPATVMELLVVQAARASAPSPKPSVPRAPKREAKPRPEAAPPSPRQRATGETELVATDDGIVYEARVVPEGASPKERQRIQATNRQKLRRARQKAEVSA